MRSFTQWPCPLPQGGISEEWALAFDQARSSRLLVIPALFDEANKLRRLTAGIMHRLNLSGIDVTLPDLAGCNDSLVPLNEQTIEGWRHAVRAAAAHFRTTHVLTIRSGALLAPSALPGWRYAPAGGRQQLRSMLRARTIAAREAGREEKIADLAKQGTVEGMDLAGWQLGPELFEALLTAPTPPSAQLTDIDQEMVGGSGLWLRAEPDDNPDQADTVAAIIAMELGEQ